MRNFEPERARHAGISSSVRRPHTCEKAKGEQASRRGRRRTFDVCSDEQFYVLLRTQESHNTHTLTSKAVGVRRVCRAGEVEHSGR